MGFPGSAVVKNPPTNEGDAKDMAFDHQVRKIPWSTKQQPAPGFLPRKFHGQRSPAGYSPWGRKELDTTAQQSRKQYLQTHRQLMPI